MTKTNKTSAASLINKARAKAAPADLLIAGGRAAALAGEQVKLANDERSTALDLLIAGLASDMTYYAIPFDICDRAGNVVESAQASLYEYSKGFKNPDGSDNRTKQSAFRSAVLPALFGVPGDQSAGAKAAWALVTGKALPAANALRGQAMTAKINDEGKLVVEGGEGEEADKIKAAAGKSTSALVTAAKGTKGTNRDNPQNDKGEGRAATPSEITRAAVAIAKLIASNPEAFAED